MSAAIVVICVDPRLEHASIRRQVAEKLVGLGLHADDVFILNEIGGNVGANLDGTLELLRRGGNAVVLGAVLHHDDCRADQQGLRQPLTSSAARLTSLLREAGSAAPVLSGSIVSADSQVVWAVADPSAPLADETRTPRP